MTYQSQGKLIAILELVICSCGLLAVVAAGITFSAKRTELIKDESKVEKYPQFKEFLESSAKEQAMFFIMPGAYLVIELVLAAMLYVGASDNKHGLLKTWLLLTLLMSGFGLVFAGFGIISSTEKITPIGITVFGYTFTGYSMWVGYSLTQESKVSVIS